MTNPGGGQPGQPGGPGQQPVFLTGADLHIKIRPGDPAFPQEMWGKTIGEAMRYYSVMRQDFVRNNDPRRPPQPPLAGEPAPGQPPAPAPAWGAAPPAPRAPAPGYVPAGQAPAAPASYGLEDVQRIVQDAVAAAMNSSPMVATSARTVRDGLRSRIPDWAQYSAEIEQELNGAPANALMDEGTWMAAYYYVKGKRMSQPGAAPVWQAPPAHESFRDSSGAIRTPLPNPNAPVAAAPAATSGQFQPVPLPAAPAAFFSEAPGPASPTAWGAAPDRRNDPVVIYRARQFGIPVEEYIGWMDGKVPPPPAGGNYVA